jgi:hypothetical protein
MQTVLRNISPSYEWLPLLQTTRDKVAPSGGIAIHQGLAPDSRHRLLLNHSAIPQHPSLGMRPDILTSPWNLPQVENPQTPETGGSTGSGEDLLDFTQSDMGWDFDFSTMDLEAFFSVYQSNDAAVL